MQDKTAVEQVHVLSGKVKMRFAPTVPTPCQAATQELVTKTQTILSKLKQFLPLPMTKKPQPLLSPRSSLLKPKQPPLQPPPPLPTQTSLKYALTLTPEHLLIGNETQLDIFHLSINSNAYIETEFLWSINKGRKITHVCVEHRKIGMLVVVGQRDLWVYHFDGVDVKKFGGQGLGLSREMVLDSTPKFVQIVQQSNICLFFEDHLQIFLPTQNFRRRYNRPYETPSPSLAPDSTFTLFFVPPNFENYINIFFQQRNSKTSNIFTLWCIELEFMASEVRAHPIQKIYEIKQSLRNGIRLNNYSKEIFLLNLGSEILALKRGYVLDSATVNLKTEQSMLQYVGSDTLLHISNKKIQVYNFSINLTTKPYKILIKPRDSIKINGINQNQRYFSVMPVFDKDYLVIFQEKGERRGGEIRYSFYVTRGISREDKMLALFPRNLTKFRIEDPVLQEKCDMAQKMGYTTKQIYLQLWNRSQKTSKDDYSTLIATQDYQTITEQIIRKLKKSSISLKQVLQTEQACLALLETRIFSPQCTYESAMNYISCHFFRRKLEMYKNIKNMRRLREKVQGEGMGSGLGSGAGDMRITIREYQFYRGMELKGQLIKYVNQLCHQGGGTGGHGFGPVGKEEVCNYIRFLLRSFRFALRTLYEQLLQQIIKNANNNLIILLKQIPQILPYSSSFTPQSPESQLPEKNFLDGIWSQIDRDEWQKHSLYIDKLLIIDNKEVILQQVVKDINFKRMWLSQHDVVTLSVEQIRGNFQRLRSGEIFYFFIGKLFEYIKEEDVLRSLVRYIEDVYGGKQGRQGGDERSEISGSIRKSSVSRRSRAKEVESKPQMVCIPQNIKGKVFLLERIYRFFQQTNIIPLKNGRPCTLIQFFNFQDHELIRHCFEKQRSIKGILLKNIKQIYTECLENHTEIFNLALLNYFVSDLSTISDLKYLLNRINNQKQEFHRENIPMFAVLIEALERKLKIGTGKDIPIDEILIYLENLPLQASENQPQPHETQRKKVSKQLEAVQSINRRREDLQQSRINMSIYDILRNPEQVFTHLIEHAIGQAGNKVWRSSEKFVKFADDRLSRCEMFSKDIYERYCDSPVCYSKTIFFIFLAKLCQKLQHIKFAKILLQEQDQINSLRSDSYTAQGLVQFMYKWKMCSTPSFTQNKPYILQLLTLIPQTSNTHIFISNQLKFSNLFSCGFLHQITYPISDTVLNCQDLREIINQRPIEFVMGIDVGEVYEIVHAIQSIVVERIQVEVEAREMGMGVEGMERDRGMDRSVCMDPECMITLAQVYQIFIVKMLNENKLKQVIPHINSLLDLPKSKQAHICDIIFPILYIIRLSEQLNQQNRENLILCIWYYFYEPKELMGVLEHIVLTALTPHQLFREIQESLRVGKERYRGYNPHNIIFNPAYMQYLASHPQNSHKFPELLQKTSKHIQSSKQQFSPIKYSIIILILCNEPFLLSKFIECSHENNVKPIRSILSYAILEEVFQPVRMLEIGRRIFLVLLEAKAMGFPIQVVMERLQGIGVQEEIEAGDFEPEEDETHYEAVMWKSAQAFRKKKQFYIKERDSGSRIIKRKPEKSQSETHQKIHQLFSTLNEQIEREPSNYIFTDSDNEQKMEMEIVQSLHKKKTKKSVKFVARNQRLAIFQSSRFNKPCALYKSIQGDLGFGLRRGKGLFVSTQSFSRGTTLQVDMPGRRISSNIESAQSQQLPSITGRKVRLSEQYYEDEPNLEVNLTPSPNINLELQSNGGSPNKSVPEINVIRYHPLMKIQSVSSQNLRDSRGEGELRDSREGVDEGKYNKFQAQNSQIKQQSQISKSQISNPYQILINEIPDPDPEDETQQTLTSATKQLMFQISENPKFIEGEFDLTPIEKLRDDPSMVRALIERLYVEHVDKESFHLAMKVILEVVGQWGVQGVDGGMFKVIGKIEQAQWKTIPSIPFSTLISLPALLKPYTSQSQIFTELYKNLQKHIVSENIYTVSKFIRRVFEDPKFEQQVIWDFVLDLCQKIDQGSPEEREWNLEKIKATLSNMDIGVWNQGFGKFKGKVLEPDSRDQVLGVFFGVVRERRGKNWGPCAEFVRRIRDVYESQEVEKIFKEFQGQGQSKEEMKGEEIVLQ